MAKLHAIETKRLLSLFLCSAVYIPQNIRSPLDLETVARCRCLARPEDQAHNDADETRKDAQAEITDSAAALDAAI
jgi:hypothetical protein